MLELNSTKKNTIFVDNAKKKRSIVDEGKQKNLFKIAL